MKSAKKLIFDHFDNESLKIVEFKVYLFQSITDISLGYNYKIYVNGPYCLDFRDEYLELQRFEVNEEVKLKQKCLEVVDKINNLYDEKYGLSYYDFYLLISTIHFVKNNFSNSIVKTGNDLISFINKELSVKFNKETILRLKHL